MKYCVECLNDEGLFLCLQGGLGEFETFAKALDAVEGLLIFPRITLTLRVFRRGSVKTERSPLLLL